MDLSTIHFGRDRALMIVASSLIPIMVPLLVGCGDDTNQINTATTITTQPGSDSNDAINIAFIDCSIYSPSFQQSGQSFELAILEEANPTHADGTSVFDAVITQELADPVADQAYSASADLQNSAVLIDVTMNGSAAIQQVASEIRDLLVESGLAGVVNGCAQP